MDNKIYYINYHWNATEEGLSEMIARLNLSGNKIAFMFFISERSNEDEEVYNIVFEVPIK